MLMTGAAAAAIPMIVVFFASQRYFVEGIPRRRGKRIGTMSSELQAGLLPHPAPPDR